MLTCGRHPNGCGNSHGYKCVSNCVCKRHSASGNRSLDSNRVSCELGCVCKRHTHSGNATGGSYGKQRDTQPERLFERVLRDRGLQYEKQKRIRNMSVDFYLPQQNLVIEVDGCYWHGCPDCCPNSSYTDAFVIKQQKLSGLGYDAIRIWEHEISGSRTN